MPRNYRKSGSLLQGIMVHTAKRMKQKLKEVAVDMEDVHTVVSVVALSNFHSVLLNYAVAVVQTVFHYCQPLLRLVIAVDSNVKY